MKRLFSILIFSLLVTTSVWAATINKNVTTGADAFSQMNPYTFNISRVLSGENIIFRYSLNATAQSIDILVDIDKDGKFEENEVAYTITDATKLTRSSKNELPSLHEVSIPLTEFKQTLNQNAGDFTEGDYNWAMRAKRTAYSNPTHAYPTNWGRLVYNMPKGLAIDNNPESNYFGNIYTTESKACASSEGIGNTLAGGNKTNYAKGEGIYAYYPTFDQYKYPTDHTCYKGGITWGTGNDEYAPFRLAIAQNGMVYVNDNRKKEDGVTASVYRINPSKLNTNLSFDKILWPGGLTSGSTYAHPRAMSMAVLNRNGKQELYVLNAYQRKQVDANNWSYHPHLHRWILNGTDIGTKQDKEWVLCKDVAGKTQSVLSYGGKTYEIVNQTTTMVPGIHNDLWIAQRRIDQSANACLMHVKIDGNNLVLDYVIVKNSTDATSVNAHLLQMHDGQACPKGAMALSADGSMVALASSGWVNVMNVTYDANGTPTLTRDDSKSFELLTTQNKPVYINALAFDRANNLYAMSETTHQFYIYALPGQASTTIPAKKATTISLSNSNSICWHPGDITNEDLLAMFKRDYEAKYQHECVFTTNHTEFQWMLTNEESQWKWLGDYFKNIGVQRRKIPTNEELWGSSNTDKNGFMYYYNQYFSLNRATQKMDQAAAFVTSANTYKILTQSNSKYKWLGDYILQVATSQKVTGLNSSYDYWGWVLHGFLNLDNKTSTRVEGNTTNKWTHNIDFRTAGKPASWRASYLKANPNVEIVDDALNIDSEWRVCAGTFFGQLGTETAEGFITTKIYNKRAYEHWKDEWIASFPQSPTTVKSKGLPSGIIRNNDIFAGWYYGNKCTSSSPGYDITTPVTVDNIAYDCVYARWLEPTLHEGYVTDEQMIAEQRDSYNNFNLDLINIIATSGEPYDLQIDRKLQGGMYNTMCLPFAIEGKTEFANIQYAEGGNPFTSVNDFSLVRYTGSEALDEVLKLTFTELGNEETLKANTPFLLKPNSDIIKLMQYGTAKKVEVVVHDQGQAIEDDGEGDNGEGDDGGGAIIPQTPAEYASTVSDGIISYTGVLAPTTIPEGSVLLVANNRLAVSTGGEMKGMRGFFSPLVLPIQQPMAIQITTKDGATTYLDAVNMTTETKAATKVLYNGQIYILRGDEVYTITGAKVK